MNGSNWLLLDTETTGMTSPIFVVDIAAQRMRSWEPMGEPFRRLLNHERDIPSEASRVHGYTREILERDGESPSKVYAEFFEYAAGLPVASYNLTYDWDTVLIPEWQRLGIAQIGSRGLCALRLAQRLLDPVPAGNCKLQSLRQYYRLEERGAHTAMGDVLTVVDLFAQVLRPIAEQRGLETWPAVTAYAADEWYPSRIAFGKHKGRSIWEARGNREMHSWLEWLAGSSNGRSAKMGRWYLRQLGMAQPEFACVATMGRDETGDGTGTSLHGAAIVLYEYPEMKKLQALVDAARTRLAELEVTYTIDKARVDSLQATLFQRLRAGCEERDRLRLAVNFLQRFLKTLMEQGEDEAAQVDQEFREAKAQSKREYERTAQALAARRELTAEQESELAKLWKLLVKLYHPDRYSNEPDKLATYGKLTAVINRAKDDADLETLRQIACDPEGFILRQGWAGLDFREEEQVAQLRKLWESLELEILNVLEAANVLRGSREFELYQIIAEKPVMLDDIVAKQAKSLDLEIENLRVEVDRLTTEVSKLTES